MENNRASFNQAATSWGDQLVAELRANSPVKSGTHRALLKRRHSTRNGVVASVGVQVARHIVYREKGARRGKGGRKGSTWYSSAGRRKTNPKSLGKMGPANEYFNPIIDRHTPRLAELMEAHWGGAVEDLIPNARIR